MPKIIRKGQVPPPKVFVGKCPRCGTEAEWEESEVEGVVIISSSCPVCRAMVVVKDKNAPLPEPRKTWRDRLPWNRNRQGGLPIPAGLTTPDP